MTYIHDGDSKDVMVLNEMIVDCIDDSQRWFPGKNTIAHLVLCAVGEVGEVANIVKKIDRGSLTIEQAMHAHYMAERGKDTIQEEIIDVLIYLCNLMGHETFKDVDWKEVWDAKRAFNEQRFGPSASYVPEGKRAY